MLVTCPFCPLRCDDLVVQFHGSRLALLDINCPLAAKGFQRVSAAAESLLTQVETTPPVAEVESIAARLAALPSLSISGTMIDIRTVRAAVRFAEAVGGVVDACETRSTAAMRRAVERDGLFAATLGELRQRADSVVLIGDPTDDCPRLFERFLSSGPVELARQRRFLSLGDASVGVPDAQHTHLRIGDEEIHRRLAEARLALRTDRSDTAGIADWLREGTYTAWLWSSDAIDPLAASALIGLIGELNRERRAVAVPLSGDATFRSVATWLSGLSGPIDFGGAVPELLENSTAATPPAAIWLQPFPTAPPPPDDGRLLVVIGMAAAEVIERADLYLPASVPGIDVTGSTVRGDGTVCLPLHAARVSPLPSAATRLAELATAVAQRRLAAC